MYYESKDWLGIHNILWSLILRNFLCMLDEGTVSHWRSSLFIYSQSSEYMVIKCINNSWTKHEQNGAIYRCPDTTVMDFYKLNQFSRFLIFWKLYNPPEQFNCHHHFIKLHDMKLRSERVVFEKRNLMRYLLNLWALITVSINTTIQYWFPLRQRCVRG